MSLRLLFLLLRPDPDEQHTCAPDTNPTGNTCPLLLLYMPRPSPGPCTLQDHGVVLVQIWTSLGADGSRVILADFNESHVARQHIGLCITKTLKSAPRSSLYVLVPGEGHAIPAETAAMTTVW